MEELVLYTIVYFHVCEKSIKNDLMWKNLTSLQSPDLNPAEHLWDELDFDPGC